MRNEWLPAGRVLNIYQIPNIGLLWSPCCLINGIKVILHRLTDGRRSCWIIVCGCVCCCLCLLCCGPGLTGLHKVKSCGGGLFLWVQVYSSLLMTGL